MNTEKLRRMNQNIIDNTLDDILVMHHLTIKKILEDDKFYFKMDAKYVYAILEDLGIEKERLKEVYRELISMENNKEFEG